MHSVSAAPTTIPDSLNFTSAEPWSLASNQEHALDIVEWLSLVSLQSPRIHVDDQIDPYLCSYSTPDEYSVSTGRLVVSRMSGFLPAEWLRQTFFILIEQVCQQYGLSPQWFALSCQAFETEVADCHDGYTILVLPSIKAADESPEDSSHIEAKGPCRRAGAHFVSWEYARA
ncbi:MAG: hypothetical protein LQ341_005106 [Variospora aurantia]|nr:MAG: hypothetical protein LQ341_005106 [Variospora aurantia]